MTPNRPGIILIAALLGGCATGKPLEGERTVFNNPYAALVIERTGIGPECDMARGQDATCLGVPLTRKGRGNTIGEDSFGSCNRNQRRILRERAELLRQISQHQTTPPQPAPPLPEPTLPTAAGADDKP